MNKPVTSRQEQGAVRTVRKSFRRLLPVPVRAPRGFALLIAVIISSVALAIGAALAAIAYKQILLSSTATDSEYAFYAADSGIECALYWDQQSDAFDYAAPFATITCGGSALTLTQVSKTAATSTMSFHWVQESGAHCADVTVAKNTNGNAAFYSVGHNTCDTSNPRLTERGMEAYY